MWSDVGAALAYVSSNISRYGGDASRMVVIGHSSGAHISALHLLTGCAPATCRGGGEDKKEGRILGFIGLSGVYDIGKHYLHEKQRGVHEISALKPGEFLVQQKCVIFLRIFFL